MMKVNLLSFLFVLHRLTLMGHIKLTFLRCLVVEHQSVSQSINNLCD